MNGLDPRLLRLREIEARLAFAEYHIGEQRALCARLTRLGLDNSLAHSLLRSMEDSIAILVLRRTDALRSLQLGESPQAVPSAPPPGPEALSFRCQPPRAPFFGAGGAAAEPGPPLAEPLE
jgi:hypothetical protein